VKTEADPAFDSIGARIEAVTPGGPAANAGLKAGDIITRFRGISLGGATPDNGDESGPGSKLVSLARALDPGDTVAIEYRRGSEKRKAMLVAEDVSVGAGPDRWEQALRLGRMPMFPGWDGGGSGGFSFCFGDAWCDMELVNLNPDLGEYFGTREGILVVKAPADSSLPVRGGDVILAIGGRHPTSASHAMRILRSYEANETVAIEILRKQKRTTVTWHVPRAEDHMRPFMRQREMRPDGVSAPDRS